MTHSDKAPTAEQLTIARRCAAKYWQTGDPSDEAAARSILSGEWDDQAYTQAALAAVIETTRLAAEMADQWRDENRANCKDALMDGAAIEMNAFAGSLRNNDHLEKTHD